MALFPHLETCFFLSPSLSILFHFYVIQKCQVNTGITSEQNVKVVLMVGDQLGQNLTLQFVVSHALDPGQELISSYFTGLDNEAPELAHCSRNKELAFLLRGEGREAVLLVFVLLGRLRAPGCPLPMEHVPGRQ